MSSSLKSTGLQKTKAEVLSLLNVLSNKVDLERKFGADYLPLAPIVESTASSVESPRCFLSGEDVESPLLKPHFDIHNERKTDELSKSEKTKELSKLERQVKKCTKCGLCKGRTNVVFGAGDPDADLMFVGEAPGYYEDVQGEPFVGRAGQLLTKIIESIGLKREEVYIANILKCRPPENRNPNANEIVTCTPHLIKQIEIIRPKIICALGTFAAQTLLDTKEAIGKLRGKFFEYQGTKFLATYHPAYLLRNPNDKKKVWSDIKKVRDYLKK
jgi:uracil-DNA glycosylase